MVMLSQNGMRAQYLARLFFDNFTLTCDDNRRETALEGGQRPQPKVCPLLPHLFHETLQ